MGEHRVFDTSDQQRTRSFVRAMLNDIQALEILIERDLIERGVQRVGVEQEMYIVDTQDDPAPVSDQVLAHLDDNRFTTELARFNLEANLAPCPIGGNFLRNMQQGLTQVFEQATAAANAVGANIVLTGILPTLGEEHVSLDNLTQEVRYRCLNDSCMASHGDKFSLTIDGIDRFEFSHECAVIEGANTSFQVHLQVEPENAGPLYNLAQLITAPLLAVAANSPLLIGRRLWHETRVALFERVLEYRSLPQMARSFPSRVGFGESWVHDSVLEIFRENAMRHHVIMVVDPVEDSLQALREGRIPELKALSLHNGTVWRWNRPCYGITNGKPHLRIENRALPAGPSIVDQVANAALFYGLMEHLAKDAGEIPQRIAFEDAKVNFFAAARIGLDARFAWLDGQRLNARDLLRHQLIPCAREGLQALKVPTADIDRYLGIIEARTKNGRTGAKWLLDSLASVPKTEYDSECRNAVKEMRQKQAGDLPVHNWELVTSERADDNAAASRKIGDIMTTDLFTVRPEDLVDLATSMMDWKHVRHVPVENADGELVGLLSTRDLLRLRVDESVIPGQPMAVSAIMQRNPSTISPDAALGDGFERMLNSDSGCLLVVGHEQLIGIVTERDLLSAAVALLPD